MEFRQTSFNAYKRNIKSGKWLAVGPITLSGALVKTTKTTRGVYNAAGKVFFAEFSSAENKQKLSKAEQARLEYWGASGASPSPITDLCKD